MCFVEVVFLVAFVKTFFDLVQVVDVVWAFVEQQEDPSQDSPA